MVYNYLLELYQVLDKRKEEIQQQISELPCDNRKLEYLQGRLLVVNDFKSFLKSHYHSKLPRKIQKLQDD